jgi:hypothetical protein
MTTTLQPVVHMNKDREYMVYVDTWEDGIRVSSQEVGYLVSQKEAVKLLEEAGCDDSSIAYAFSTAEDV